MHHWEPLSGVHSIKSQNQQYLMSKIWFNLELGLGTMGHLKDWMPLKCMYMPGDHISTTANP
jgi:hypothetical protein